ncbi:MAG TPA: ATP-binding protein [Pelolinea sp.]|nr:ATP-binding protein [Pelolinea sp.]
MIKAIRSSWTLKILLAIWVIVIFSFFIHTIVMNLSISAAFDRHIGRMGEGMQTMMGNMRGVNLYETFRAAVNDSLLISAAVAFIIAGVAGLVISRLITRPVKNLTDASLRIANGDYAQRVPRDEIQSDELGQLALSFNQMAEKLEQTETIRRQMIGDISHELRTPLTAIKGSLEGLMDGVLAAEDLTYQQIYREADRLQRLVEDLQELSRVEAVQFKLNKKVIKVKDLVENSTNTLEGAFSKKEVKLDYLVGNELPDVQADHDRVLQVLQNLLGNALQFTPKGGEVMIEVKVISGFLEFSVKDNGAGIDVRHLAHIFERFYRADPSRSRANGGGSGIGLTISKSLIEAHGGRIWAESKGKGRGSIFFFTLPV